MTIDAAPVGPDDEVQIKLFAVGEPNQFGDLPAGLHELLLTADVQDRLASIPSAAPSFATVDEADEPHVLARHIHALTQRALESTKNTADRINLVNDLVERLAAHDERVVAPTSHLTRLVPNSDFEAARYPDVRPSTPLSESALLTNSKGEPSLAAELRAELDTADEVDLLCAFVKWYGLRLLEPELRRRRERGAPLRVITTTYMGATERRALDRLVREFGAEVKIQYDNNRTRLHAKAWLFRRDTRFDTAYVGSSNLSSAALLEGLEWNVRLSRIGTPALLEKFRATFDTYWNDPSFGSYDPETDAERLDAALAEASGSRKNDRVTLSLSGLEVNPHKYQQTMLDDLEAERVVHNRHRNLVVAATGTGKTVLAAIDYRRLGTAGNERPTLLFVAHRKEILEQARRTYREVLADANFGELFVGGARPEQWKHVFASVQSLQSYGATKIPAEYFEIVVIDEFHHAQAPTYRALLEHLTPRELLGLTATPERADGVNVASFFDARIASELRLWDALGEGFLTPFHYFAVADGTDLRNVAWTRGRYEEAWLSNVYTGNRARAAMVLTQLRAKVLDIGRMRALGFCVSVAHAEYMAQVFNSAGIPARAVSGSTPLNERAQAIQDLKDRRVNALFAADLFNEGVDIPEVDVVLFLRPTESATVFLQQLGRGLRLAAGKAVLTVLDFVGHQRKEFRFDTKFRALTGETLRGLERAIERGFPFLPSGSQIVMDKTAQAIVLENVRAQLATQWKDMVSELRAHKGGSELSAFLDETGVELADVLRQGNKSWTQLRRDAGRPTPTGGDREVELLRRVRAFAHVDDPLRAEGYERLLTTNERYDDLSIEDQRLARMLVFSAWSNGGVASYDDGLSILRSEPAFVEDLLAVTAVSADRSRHIPVTLQGPLAGVPLQVHARYQREEILAALDYATLSRTPRSVMQGVVYSKDLDTDILFVTLKKSEADYSPTTMYQDYPISPNLFHWESQSTTTLASPTGQRYTGGLGSILLFVRHEKMGEYGTNPYLFLGPVKHVSHQGEKPIAITWRLSNAMPSDFFSSATVAVS